MEFIPRPAPEYEDPKLRELAKWVEGEFRRMSLAGTEAGSLPLQELHVLPDKPREGHVVRADGADWNPGQGKGTYEFVNGLWRKMAGIADGTYGDITVSGSGTVFTIGANKVTLAQLAQLATARFLGRITAGTGNVEALTGTQATTLFDVFTSLLKGLVPASGGGTTNFLRADGWNPLPTPATTYEEILTASGTSVLFDNIPAFKALIVGFQNVSHNSGFNQTFNIEVSINNGSSFLASIPVTSSLSGASSFNHYAIITRAAGGNTLIIGNGPAGGASGTVAPGAQINAVRVSPSAGSFDAGDISVTSW